MQSKPRNGRARPELPGPARRPRHVAIILDGNGRWAMERGLPRSAGHRRGAAAVRRVVEGAARLGVETLSLFAFSSDNWRRPRAEVELLMALFERFLASERERCVTSGVRVEVIGRRDRLSRSLLEAIAATERATRNGRRLMLRLAVDYSARDAILAAARALSDRGDERGLGRAAFAAAIASATHASPAPEVDLLIRTGGERRLSDFLLWECAYAELYFTRRMWPDFGAQHLAAALADFARRTRRFGALRGAPRAAGAILSEDELACRMRASSSGVDSSVRSAGAGEA